MRQAWRNFVVASGKKLRTKVNRLLLQYSTVGNPPVFDPGVFPWTAILEAQWQTIRAEALAVLQQREAVPPVQEISPDHARLADYENKWQSYFIWGYGYKLAANAARCPRTTALVEQIPGLKSALFSIHAPGVHIPRHNGVTFAMITCHLGLIVPQEREKCRIKIADQTYHWEPGKTVVFDDTYEHEVWNDTEEDRVILLIQFTRPLRFPGRQLASFFMWLIRMSPFVQDARRAAAKWERKLDRR
jgi:beta-hydroxylase